MQVFSPKRPMVGRVLLLEDDLLTGEWFGQSMSRYDVEVYWTQAVDEAKALLSADSQLQFHAIVTDIYLDKNEPLGLQMLEMGKKIDLPVCVITSRADYEMAKQAIEKSALCLLEKPFEIKDLLGKLMSVWNEPRFLSAVLERLMEMNSLTTKETEVCRLLVKGLSNKEVASILSVTEKTVKFHVTSIFEKFGVKSRNELQSFIFPT